MKTQHVNNLGCGATREIYPLGVYVRREERSQINNQSFYFKKLEKEDPKQAEK